MEVTVTKLTTDITLNRDLKVKPKRIRKYKPGICEYCNKVFADNRHLYAHVRIHTGEKPFVCNVCNKGFNQSSNLRRHVTIHTERKPLYCAECEKYFVSEEYFHKHVRNHKEPRRFGCHICSKNYSHRNTLNRHIMSHLEDRSVFCEICHEQFTSIRWLNNHMRIHDPNVESFVCALCKRVFSQQCHLDYHIYNTHKIEIAFQCNKCNKRFPDRRRLRAHKEKGTCCILQNKIITEIKEEKIDEQAESSTSEKHRYLCGICSAEFFSVTSVKEHVSTHIKTELFVCELCQENFDSELLLQEHIQLTHAVEEHCLACYICEKKFIEKNDLRKHLLSHTEEVQELL